MEFKKFEQEVEEKRAIRDAAKQTYDDFCLKVIEEKKAKWTKGKTTSNRDVNLLIQALTDYKTVGSTNCTDDVALAYLDDFIEMTEELRVKYFEANADLNVANEKLDKAKVDLLTSAGISTSDHTSSSSMSASYGTSGEMTVNSDLLHMILIKLIGIDQHLIPDKVLFTNETLREAVNCWFSDRASAILQYGQMSSWDVSQVTDMSNLFIDKSRFNENISRWNVSNVTNMSGMFRRAKCFDQPLDKWNVSSVRNMSHMLAGAEAFNQPLGNWNVSNVINMSSMFFGAIRFNQPLGDWDVSKVTTMYCMFAEAKSFYQPLDCWNRANVQNMNGMFERMDTYDTEEDYPKFPLLNVSYQRNFPFDTKSLKEAVDLWCSNRVAAENKYGPIEFWNTSRVTNMSTLFKGKSLFNEDISRWNTEAVLLMEETFCDATSFNQPLDTWNIRSVQKMRGMFCNAFKFNQPLNSWVPLNSFYEGQNSRGQHKYGVTDMSLMFSGAASFNQPLTNWKIVSQECEGMFNGASQFDVFANCRGWVKLPIRFLPSV